MPLQAHYKVFFSETKNEYFCTILFLRIIKLHFKVVDLFICKIHCYLMNELRYIEYTTNFSQVLILR